MRVRLCIVLALAGCLAGTASLSTALEPGALIAAAVTELLLGLLIAFGFQVAFASLSFAGRALDVQAGYGLALVIDPGSRAQSPMFGTLFSLRFSTVRIHALLLLELRNLLQHRFRSLHAFASEIVFQPAPIPNATHQPIDNKYQHERDTSAENQVGQQRRCRAEQVKGWRSVIGTFLYVHQHQRNPGK
jgi:hypothetical protein